MSRLAISLRLRLFVITSLIVAGALAAVLAAGWTRVLDFEVGRLDERLCMEARRIASDPAQGRDLPRLASDIQRKLGAASGEQVMLRIAPRDGMPPVQTPGARLDAPEGSSPPAAQGPTSPPCALHAFMHDGEEWRAARFAAPQADGLVAANLAAPRQEIRRGLRHALFIIVPLAIVLTALSSWLLSSLMMRPVDRLRLAMRAMSPQALDQRLPSAGEDREFRELIGAYNAMLGRLEASFQQAIRFSADAAHELKTPLTVLRGRLEQARSRQDLAAVQQDLMLLVDEVGQLSGIVRKLLLLSQADAGSLALHREKLDLSQLLEEIVTDFQMLVEAPALTADITPGLSVAADAQLLPQALNNLFSNAIRYRCPGGWIRIGLHRAGDDIEIRIANASAAIPPEERHRFFERFYRGSAARAARDIEGSGLGLSLAREIVQAHGGTLSLLDSATDEVHLSLTLPAAQTSSARS